MGNKCSIDKKKESDDENISEYDKTIYAEKREKVFYGTIAICVLYASFAILLLLASYLSEKVKYILLNNFLPFIIVYIIGTIIIVIYLIDQVVNFKPYKIDRNGEYDDLSCPDYWILEKIEKSESDKDTFKSFFSSNVNPNLFKYRCILNDKIFDRYDIYKANEQDGRIFTTNSSGIMTEVTGDSGKTNYYQYTNVDTVNNTVNTKQDGDNKHLFVNVLNNTLPENKNVYSNIFKKDDNIKLSFIKNILYMNNYTTLSDYKETDNIIVFKNTIDSTNINKIGDYSMFNKEYDYSIESGNTNNTKLTYSNYIKIDKTNIKDIKIYKSDDLNKTITGGFSPDVPINNLPMICDNTYPLFLSANDSSLNKSDKNYDNNVFRCAYSKICKIPWSDMNCDKYTSP